jgi:large subunit ribosomal protein L49
MINHGGIQRLTRRLFTTSRQVVSTNTENLSFSVLRTSNGQFPVYKVYKNNGKIVNTVVKHVRGDLNECRKALANICESPVKIHMGSLEVRGIHTWKVKEFLESVGL